MSNQELVRVETPEEPRQLLELDSRRDAFMNRVRLLWDPGDNSVHLKISSTTNRDHAIEVVVPADEATDWFEHPYPHILADEERAGRVGESLVESLITVEPVAEAA